MTKVQKHCKLQEWIKTKFKQQINDNSLSSTNSHTNFLILQKTLGCSYFLHHRCYPLPLLICVSLKKQWLVRLKWQQDQGNVLKKKNSHFQWNKRPFCSPRTAGQDVCPTEEIQMRTLAMQEKNPKNMSSKRGWCLFLTIQWTRILRGIQKMRENTTTEPTMLSAKNFPDEELKVGRILQAKREHEMCDDQPKPPTKRVYIQLVDKIPQSLNHILDLFHALPLFKKKGNQEVMRTFPGFLVEALRFADSHSHRRSPQCRVCPSAGKESCRQPGWQESRNHFCPCNTLCRSCQSLQKRNK